MKPGGSLFPWRSRAQIARDVDSELAFHLETRIAELVQGGLGPDAARRRAADEFGDIEFTRAYCRELDARADREVRQADRLVGAGQDIHHAWRTLRRSPGFVAISLVTLALAIGANTAIFSVTRAVLLKPLPYGHPAALIMMAETWPGHPDKQTPLSPPDAVDYQAGQHTFTSLATVGWNHTMTWRPDHGDPGSVAMLPVGANFFATLEARPMLGRTFAPGDDTRGNERKAVVSYAFWRGALGGDSAAIGGPITLDNQRYQLIGVMPPGFTFAYNEDIWLPLELSDDLSRPATTRKQHWIHLVGRLKPGVTIDAARADLATTSRRLATQYPDADSGRAALVQPLHTVIVGNLHNALLLLLGGAAMVLLIACANLANLTLARTSGRRRELAVRAALGAGRGRMIRQLLIESVMLSTAGGVLGVGIAALATRVLLSLNPGTLPPIFAVAIDARVLAFSLALAIGTGVAFGIVPALDAARSDLNVSLREGGRGASAGRSAMRTRRTLVITQVGLAVMLLIGAGLLLRSFAQLTRVRLGFDSSHVLTAQLRAAGDRYDSAAAVNRVFDGVLDGLRAAPGIVSVGAATLLPTQGRVGTSLRIEGQPADEANLPDLGYVSVRGDYFQAMRIPLKAGRTYTSADAVGAPEVAILNETAARQLFPRGDAIGHRIRIGPDPNGKPIQIVGIVGDVRDERIETPTGAMLYANHRQEAWDNTLSIVVRTTGAPESAIPALRRAVHDADPTLALRDIQSMDHVVGANLASRRFALGLIWCFAAIALLLAAVGVYGVLAYTVSNRTREFGVRLALGASTGSVLRLVLRLGVAWSLAGLGFGIGGAMAGSRLLAGSLYGVGAIDATTYGAVAAGLLLVVVAACLIPASRATLVDPVTSMRAE